MNPLVEKFYDLFVNATAEEIFEGESKKFGEIAAEKRRRIRRELLLKFVIEHAIDIMAALQETHVFPRSGAV